MLVNLFGDTKLTEKKRNENADRIHPRKYPQFDRRNKPTTRAMEEEQWRNQEAK